MRPACHRARRRRRDALLLGPVASVAGKNITTIEGLAFPPTASFIRCKPPGVCRRTFRNAVTASPARSLAAAALLKEKAQSHRCRHQWHHQHLPLRHLYPHPACDPSRGCDQSLNAQAKT